MKKTHIDDVTLAHEELANTLRVRFVMLDIANAMNKVCDYAYRAAKDSNSRAARKKYKATFANACEAKANLDGAIARSKVAKAAYHAAMEKMT
jgi:hypothetical protein